MFSLDKTGRLTMDDLLSIVKPENERIVAQHRAEKLAEANAVLLGFLDEVEAYLGDGHQAVLTKLREARRRATR